MKRDVDSLAAGSFDLVVVGGGIHGVAAAREAVLRGLRVALVERQDFGWATSSQSARIAHCGMRYLQHADFKRMRESIREGKALVTNAPHLVDKLPFLLPVRGHGIAGIETTALYLKTFDLLSIDRGWFKDEARRMPHSRMVGPAQVMEMAPGIEPQGLSGGAIWTEGQMHNTERLLLANLRAATTAGLVAANYVEATRIRLEGDRVAGIDATDRLTGRSFTIDATAVLNATGPWIVDSLVGNGFKPADYGIHLSKSFSLITRPWTNGFALSFPIRPMYRDRRAVIDKASNIQFAIPWRGATMLASLHLPCEDDPASVTISEEEIETYIEVVNASYSEAKLQRSDVRHVLWGMIPAEEKGSAAPLKYYKIIDHAEADGIRGLVTTVGVKFTTSRDVAQKAVDVAAKYLSRPLKPSSGRFRPLWGGDIEYLDAFRQQAAATSRGLRPDVLHPALHRRGSGSGCDAALLAGAGGRGHPCRAGRNGRRARGRGPATHRSRQPGAADGRVPRRLRATDGARTGLG
jgi:glycerol-3-phosphate dehydrogenase